MSLLIFNRTDILECAQSNMQIGSKLLDAKTKILKTSTETTYCELTGEVINETKNFPLF